MDFTVVSHSLVPGSLTDMFVFSPHIDVQIRTLMRTHDAAVGYDGPRRMSRISSNINRVRSMAGSDALPRITTFHDKKGA